MNCPNWPNLEDAGNVPSIWRYIGWETRLIDGIFAWKGGYMSNRPLALRGHVTNASFKQWVGILLMPKIDIAHKNYLTPEIWEETHLGEIFHDTLIFQQSSIICIGRHVGGYTLAVQHGGQNYFLHISC